MHRHTSHCTRGLSAEERLLHFLPDRPAGKCWIFTGALNHGGYGVLGLPSDTGRSVQVRAHRLAYELWVGPIPDEHTVDHVRKRGCASTACCNPQHLDAVTSAENSLRSKNPRAINARRQQCLNGHDFDEERRVAGKIYRSCSTCRRARGRKHDAIRRRKESKP